MTKKLKKYDLSNKLYCPLCGGQNCDTASIENLSDKESGPLWRIWFECFNKDTNCQGPIGMFVDVVDLKSYTDMV